MLNDETLPNFMKRKHPRKEKKKIQWGKDQSPGKTAQMRWATWRKGRH